MNNSLLKNFDFYRAHFFGHQTKNMEPKKLQTYFLIQISFIYLWAFCSLYWQIPGLYGDNGITPARSLLKCENSNISECIFYGDRPTLLHFTSHFSFTTMQGMDILCILGIFLSSLSIIFETFRDTFVYLTLWDTLLLETGFLTVLVAPCRTLRNKWTTWMPHDNVTLFLVRWLAFRLMFASGVVKLTSECPTWWGLTALNYHYESQCIPTSWAWFAHQLPEWFHRFSVVATYVIEIFLPPLFLLPIKHLRKFAFSNQVLFMILITITGNYNFFNLITITICSAMLVDSDNSLISSTIVKKYFPKLYFLIKWLFTIAIYCAIFYWTVKLFSLQIVNNTVQSKIAFSKSDFYATLSWAMPKLVIFASFCFLQEVVCAIFRSVFDFWKFSTFTTIRVVVQCVAMCSLCSLMFVISLAPFSHLDHNTHSGLWPDVKELHALLDKYQLTHSYGLFRSMTGVGGRPEVIMEGANNLNGPWKEYEFFYKPGALDRPLPFVIPHQPRLDWQMWFAALGSYQHNPWFISLTYKLLSNELQVLKLMDKNPFPKKPPKYIRAQLYHYHFTSLWSTTRTDKNSTKNWWIRELQHEYMPPISSDNVGVLEFLKKNGLLIENPQRPTNTTSTRVLRIIRRYSNQFNGPQFVWLITLAVIVVSVVKCKMQK